MHRVLVPLDGTAAAEAALPLARLLVRRAEAELLLVHTVELQAELDSVAAGSIAGAPVVPFVPDAATLRARRRAGQDYLDDVLARTHASLRVAAPERRASEAPSVGAAEVTPPREGTAAGRLRGLLLEGNAAAAVHSAALDAEADLVVMASHARRGFARLMLGSVAADVVRGGTVPVLVVPRGELASGDSAPGASPDAREAPLPRHLLIALDGSPEAEAILAPATALARLLGSAVTLATVRGEGSSDRATLLPTSILDTTASGGCAGAPVPAGLVEGAGDAAPASAPDERAYLASVARRLEAEGCAVTTRVLDGSAVAERLLDCAAEIDVDWFALVSHGRGLWAQLVGGSVADALLQHASAPVLLLYPRETVG